MNQTASDEIENNALAEEVERGLKAVRDAAAPHPFKPAAVAGATEIERFLASGTKMLVAQRKKILGLESAYELERVKLVDGYRVRLRDLEDEAGDAVRALDLKHEADLKEATRILDALIAMRGAGG